MHIPSARAATCCWLQPMAAEVLFEVMAIVAGYGGVFTTLELQKTSRRSSTALEGAPVLEEAHETHRMSVSGAGPDLNIAAWAWGLGAWWDVGSYG